MPTKKPIVLSSGDELFEELSTLDTLGASFVNIGGATLLNNNPLGVAGTVSGTLQTNVQNKSSDGTASTDVVVTSDNGTDTTNYANFGINSSNYNVASFSITGPNDAYLYSSDTHIAIGTAKATKTIKFHTGGTLISNLRATVDDQGINLPSGHTFRVNGSVIGGGGAALYIQDTEPVSAGLWLQTNVGGDPNSVMFWLKE